MILKIVLQEVFTALTIESQPENGFDDERIQWLEKRYSEPDIQYFENPIIVDNKSGEITY